MRIRCHDLADLLKNHMSKVNSLLIIILFVTQGQWNEWLTFTHLREGERLTKNIIERKGRDFLIVKEGSSRRN